MTIIDDKLLAMITRHEGLMLKTYQCPAGKLTIGVGHNLEANPLEGITEGSTISQARALEILLKDVTACVDGLRRHLPWFDSLDEARQAVLIDMCFNLGLWGLLKFKLTLAAIQAGDYERAASQMLQSKWAHQVGRRAQRLSQMMRLGEWPA
jgi:lysozyme